MRLLLVEPCHAGASTTVLYSTVQYDVDVNASAGRQGRQAVHEDGPGKVTNNLSSLIAVVQ